MAHKEYVAIIMDNSLKYIDIMLNMLVDKKCVVLLDKTMPFSFLMYVLKNIDIKKIYIDDYNKKQYGEVLSGYDVCYIKENTENVEKVSRYIYERFKIFEKIESNEDAIVFFSSGTTGQSKGIRLSYDAIKRNIESIIGYMDVENISSILISKSFTHSSTIVGELFVGLKLGLQIYVMKTSCSYKVIIDTIMKNNIDIYCMNPTMLYMLLKAFKQRKQVPAKLKYIYVSGSICDKKILDEAEKILKYTKVLNVYGLTELGPRVTAQRYNEFYEKGSVGKPVTDVEIKVVSNNRCCNKFEKGIVYVKTKSKMNGYCINNNYVESEKIWFYTGDVGYINETGELVIVGRYDNMVIIGGHNVYPEAVEEIIQMHPDVNECVVMAAEDKLYGERLQCYYTQSLPTDNAIKRSDMYTFCEKYLAKYEIPFEYICVKEIPKTRTGKKKRIRGILEIM